MIMNENMIDDIIDPFLPKPKYRDMTVLDKPVR